MTPKESIAAQIEGQAAQPAPVQEPVATREVLVKIARFLGVVRVYAQDIKPKHELETDKPLHWKARELQDEVIRLLDTAPPAAPVQEPYGYVSTHTSGLMHFNKTFHGVYTDTATGIVAVYTHPAPAAPVQEPVAWTGCGECDRSFSCHEGMTACIRNVAPECYAQPAPVPIKPIVDPDLDVNQRLAFKFGWKSAEEAHGITAAPEKGSS